MATPARTVQYRKPEGLLNLYQETEIIPWAIKTGDMITFKYEGDSLDEGAAILAKRLKDIVDNQSAGIYTFCVYDHLAEGEGINHKTPCGYGLNFRFCDTPIPGSGQLAGVDREVMAELAAMRKEIQELKEEREAEPASRLGAIGELMQSEELRPIVMAIAGKIADWISEPAKVGELRRVSGIPGLETELPTLDPACIHPIRRLQLRVMELPKVLAKLADLAEQHPKKFAFYLAMIMKMN